MTSIVTATRNARKVAEILAILGSAFRVVSLDEYPGAPAIAECAETFAGNATLKAEGLAAWLDSNKAGAHAGQPFYVLGDDSGLEVDALGGAPGVRSARFAADDPQGTENSPDAANNAKLLRLLENVPAGQRAARFRCALALSTLAGDTLLFEGRCEGSIALGPSGTGGFGYDPLFVPEGCARPFAELGDDVKNKISHRARALAQVRRFLDSAA
ncbi:MAG TPA: non-canonical purine NTP pyrophosphatase [Verrucomicrobiae bacterium]|jgi:XTP/dITP diphosphohydrolase